MTRTRRMRRLSILAGAISLVWGLALALPAAATAAHRHLRTAAAACNDNAYPPSPHAQIMASTTTPSLNETIEASGTAYCPNEDVRITLDGKFVTTTHTDGTGTFDPPVKVTAKGRPALCGIGASGLAADRDCLTLTVKTHGTGGKRSHNPNGGGTSFTGVDILLLCLLAAVLLGAGWAFAAAGRRKRATADAHSSVG